MSGAVYGEHRPQQGGAWRSSNNAKPSKLGFQQGSDLHDGHGHGAAPLESVHHGRGAKEDPGMNGYRTRIFEGSGEYVFVRLLDLMDARLSRGLLSWILQSGDGALMQLSHSRLVLLRRLSLRSDVRQ